MLDDAYGAVFSTPRRSILIVEDDEDMRPILEASIAEHGYEVHAVGDGKAFGNVKQPLKGIPVRPSLTGHCQRWNQNQPV